MSNHLTPVRSAPSLGKSSYYFRSTEILDCRTLLADVSKNQLFRSFRKSKDHGWSPTNPSWTSLRATGPYEVSGYLFVKSPLSRKSLNKIETLRCLVSNTACIQIAQIHRDLAGNHANNLFCSVLIDFGG